MDPARCHLSLNHPHCGTLREDGRDPPHNPPCLPPSTTAPGPPPFIHLIDRQRGGGQRAACEEDEVLGFAQSPQGLCPPGSLGPRWGPSLVLTPTPSSSQSAQMYVKPTQQETQTACCPRASRSAPSFVAVGPRAPWWSLTCRSARRPSHRERSSRWAQGYCRGEYFGLLAPSSFLEASASGSDSPPRPGQQEARSR